MGWYVGRTAPHCGRAGELSEKGDSRTLGEWGQGEGRGVRYAPALFYFPIAHTAGSRKGRFPRRRLSGNPVNRGNPLSLFDLLLRRV